MKVNNVIDNENVKPKKSLLKKVIILIFIAALISLNVYIFILIGNSYGQLVASADTNSSNPILKAIGKIHNITKTEVKGEDATERTLKITVLGNVVADTLLAEQDKNSEYNFEDISTYIKNSDATITSFEGTISDSSNKLIKALGLSGVDVIGLGNEKTISSEKNLTNTLSAINDSGMSAVGAYKTAESKRPIIIEKNNIRIGILSYGEDLTSSVTDSSSCVISEYGKAAVLNDIDYLVTQDVDFMVALVNFNKATTKSTAQEKSVAEFMAENGINAMFGYHSETIKDAKYVSDNKNAENICFSAYSMGNLISSNVKSSYDMGMVFSLEFKKTGTNRRLDKIEMIPTYISKQGNKYKVMNAKQLVDSYKSDSKSSDITKSEYDYLDKSIKEINKIVKTSK